jgi:hypothetical protein
MANVNKPHGTRRSRRKLVRAYAEKLPGTVLGIFWKEFKGLLSGHGGIYVLYKHGVPHYVGKASNLSWRIRAHLKDRLKHKWDTFSLYVITGDRYMKDVESLLLQIVEPKGALVSGRFRGATNLRRELMPNLERYADALTELKNKPK